LGGFGWEDWEGEREQPSLLWRDEGGSEGGGQLGAGRATLNLKCRATTSGAASTRAALPIVAPHLPGRAPLSRRGSMCCATESGAAPPSVTPPWMARPKRVIQVKLFRRWFIIYDCIKFRLILSKSPLQPVRMPVLSPAPWRVCARVRTSTGTLLLMVRVMQQHPVRRWIRSLCFLLLGRFFLSAEWCHMARDSVAGWPAGYMRIAGERDRRQLLVVVGDGCASLQVL
jgi:hypothetical protein